MNRIVRRKGWALGESQEERRANDAAAAERAGRLIGFWLPAEAIQDWCSALRYRWRERAWGPVVTLWACVMKHVQGNCGARSMEDWLISMRDCVLPGSIDGRDFCRARARLPEDVWWCGLKWLGAKALCQAGMRAFGLRVLLVDGSTSQAADTPANAETFGRSRNQEGESRLPLVRWVLMICAGCGAVVDASMGGYHESEQAFFAALVERLTAGCLVVADRGLCSFMAFWVIQQRGSHFLCRHHQRRKGRKVRRLGYKDDLMEWSYRDVRFVRCHGWWAWIPLVKKDLRVRVVERQIVRKGYRTFTLRICTSLLDPRTVPAGELMELYLKRWRIEGAIRDLKTGFGIDRLRGKTPDIARKEIWSGLLAYTLVSMVRAEAFTGESDAEEAWELSTRRTCLLLLRFVERAVEATPERRRFLCWKLKAAVAATRNKPQKRPPEPRYLIVPPSRFEVLPYSRKEWKERYRSQIACA
jgi:hypothetical protein